jgi:hypothetical protein
MLAFISTPGQSRGAVVYRRFSWPATERPVLGREGSRQERSGVAMARQPHGALSERACDAARSVLAPPPTDDGLGPRPLHTEPRR